MRFETNLCDLYNRWLDQPGNSNVPKACAMEALHEVFHQQVAHKNEGNTVGWRKTVRLTQQNQWLTRFIRAWAYFERTT